MLQKVIEKLKLEDYYFSVDKNNQHNSTGKTELWTLNSDKPVAVGYKNCIDELYLYVKNR